MPTYDYICSNCGHRAEILHGVHDETPRTCAECGGQMRKAITAPSIVFKGTGWAKVDRRSGSGRSKSGSSEGEGTGDAAPGTAATPASDASSGTADAPTPTKGATDGGTSGSGSTSGTKPKSSSGSD